MAVLESSRDEAVAARLAQDAANIAVYLPMGYMIGGYTVFVPREWVQVLDMSVEEAMRSSLTAWMGNTKNPADPV